jgi:hypothetical protein
VGRAGAQQWTTDPVNAQARINAAVVNTCLRDPSAYAAQKQKFNEYFQAYYFPEMTQTGEENLGRLGNMRYDLFKRYLWNTSNAQLQKDLTEMAFAAMRQMLKSTYHPAVRYNAVLVLGLLDSKYDLSKPPTPHAASNALLQAILNAGMDPKSNVPGSLLLGAVIGLDRHAQFRQTLPPANVDSMTKTLLKLVSLDKPVQEMDRDSFSWLQLKGAGALARMGTPGPNNAIHDAIVKFIDRTRSLDDRCAAVALLDKLDYKAAKVDGPGTAEPLFKLARDLGDAEDKRAKKFEDPVAGGAVSFPVSVGPEMGPGFASMQPGQELFPRQHVLARLLNLKKGLTKIKPALPDDSQKKIDAILAAINPVITAAASKDTGQLRLTGAIRTMAGAINRAVPPARPEADETDEDDVLSAPPATEAAPTAAAPARSANAVPAATPPAAQPVAPPTAPPANVPVEAATAPAETPEPPATPLAPTN